MKVLVVNPPWPGKGYGVRTNSRWPHRRPDKIFPYPIYLAYMISVLKEANVNVDGLDAIVGELSMDEFQKKVVEKRPDMVVLETSTPSIEWDLKSARLVRDVLGDEGKVILIGSHASVFHRQILEENPFVDVIVRGEFEYAIRDLALEKNLESILGASYRDKDGVHVNGVRPHIEDLDSLPFPDREVFPIEDYVQGWYRKKTALMITSRGCPFRCVFCSWPQTMYGRFYRSRSPKNVVDEIEFLVKNYGVGEIDFDDDTFTLDGKRVVGICDEIKKRDIHVDWTCMGRVAEIKKEMLERMRDAGCYYIQYGVESGDSKVLRTIKKGITLKQAKDAVKWSREIGLRTHATFMFGLPGESDASIEKTIAFAKELDPDTVQFSVAMPYPGTEFYEKSDRENRIKSKSWSDFDGSHDSLVETGNVSHNPGDMVSRAYREFYLRPKVILRELSRVRNPRELRTVLKGSKTILEKIFFYKK